MDPHRGIDTTSALYAIVGVTPKREYSTLPTGVFLSRIASEETYVGPSGGSTRPESLARVQNLTEEYKSQGRLLFDLLAKAEYEQRYILPETYEDADYKDQYFSLKNRMAEIYRNKTPLKLLTIKLVPDLEFEQLEALEKAFYSHFEKNKGEIEVSGSGEAIDDRILQVVKLAKDRYCAGATDRLVSFTVHQCTYNQELVDQINDNGFYF